MSTVTKYEIARDYINQVTKTQGRYLDNIDMWGGYRSLFPTRITEEEFITLYESIKEGV